MSCADDAIINHTLITINIFSNTQYFQQYDILSSPRVVALHHYHLALHDHHTCWRRRTRSLSIRVYLWLSTKPKSPKSPKRAALCSSPLFKSSSAKKSAKKQKQKLTRNCLTLDEKAEKIKLIQADCQRILDNELEEDHSYIALCLKHNLPRSCFFARGMCVSVVAKSLMHKATLSNAFERSALVKSVINALQGFFVTRSGQQLHSSCPTLYHALFATLQRLLWWRMQKMKSIT